MIGCSVVSQIAIRSKVYRRRSASDILFALLQLVQFLPLLIVIAASIKLFDRGPVLFRQETPAGEGPRIFAS
jgi:lipopolysaccharide/colanic/teichoic acid biosynthesis glycosyltransferase